jgi:adenosylcobyric acid synthase
MLGRVVRDPDGIEGPVREAEGLGLLDVETVMVPEKTVRNSEARSTLYDVPLSGYEIHLGETTGPDCLRPSAMIDGRPDDAVSADGRVVGTYLHGLFTSDAFRRCYLAEFGLTASAASYRETVDEALNAIAEKLEQVLDIDALFALAGRSQPSA